MTTATRRRGKRFDPRQPRNPHTGEWIDTIPNGYGGTVRPVRATGLFRDIGNGNPDEPALRAEELHRRMQGDRPWTRAQIDALYDYTTDDYVPINGALRGERQHSGRTLSATAYLRSTMRPIPDNVVLHREAAWKAFGLPMDADPTDAQVEQLVGRTFHDPAFLSTSVNERHGFLQLRINTPAGTRGAYIGENSTTTTEKEMLLDLGTHMKIGGFRRNPKDRRVVILDVTVVGQDD